MTVYEHSPGTYFLAYGRNGLSKTLTMVSDRNTLFCPIHRGARACLRRVLFRPVLHYVPIGRRVQLRLHVNETQRKVSSPIVTQASLSRPRWWRIPSFCRRSSTIAGISFFSLSTICPRSFLFMGEGLIHQVSCAHERSNRRAPNTRCTAQGARARPI